MQLLNLEELVATVYSRSESLSRRWQEFCLCLPTTPLSRSWQAAFAEGRNKRLKAYHPKLQIVIGATIGEYRVWVDAEPVTDEVQFTMRNLVTSNTDLVMQVNINLGIKTMTFTRVARYYGEVAPNLRAICDVADSLSSAKLLR